MRLWGKGPMQHNGSSFALNGVALGVLDAVSSRHYLTTLKHAYLNLAAAAASLSLPACTWLT